MDVLKIWDQRKIPVIYKPSDGRLLVRMPSIETPWVFLREQVAKKAKWDKRYRCWTISRSKLDLASRILVRRFEKVYLIQPTREKEVCAPACWHAEGVECSCSCLGANHGKDAPGGRWYTISETLAVQWKEASYSCKLIEGNPEYIENPKKSEPAPIQASTSLVGQLWPGATVVTQEPARILPPLPRFFRQPRDLTPGIWVLIYSAADERNGHMPYRAMSKGDYDGLRDKRDYVVIGEGTRLAMIEAAKKKYKLGQ